MTVEERLDIGERGRLADGVGHIERVEVAGIDEAVHRAQIDVVRIHVIGSRPTELSNGTVGRAAYTGGLGADDIVFAIRFIPNRDDFNTLFCGQQTGFELGFGLMRESVSHSKRIFTE